MVNSARVMKSARRVARLVVTILLLVLVLLPIYWMFNTSFKLQPEIFRIPPTVVPFNFTVANYRAIMV